MTAKKEENLTEAKTARNKKVAPAVEETAASENFPKELGEAFWSVISFDKCEAHNLTYTEAEQKIGELEAAGVSGLCIVTDEAAARVRKQTV